MKTADPVATPEMSLVPPELRGTIPRDVRLTAAGSVLVAMAIAAAAAAFVTVIVLSVVHYRAAKERQLRERAGVSATARVEQVVVRRGEHPRRIVTYRYDVGGRSYVGRVTLHENDRRNIARGTPMRIEFVPWRPEASWMAGDRPSGVPIVLIPLTALALLAAGAVIARILRRQWILLSEGRAALARVTGFKKVQREHKRKAYRVSYEFKTLSGARQTSRCEIGKAPPPIGSVIPIIYHRDQPTWSATYPLALVRPFRRR
jgi:hypothetical protein